MLSADFRECMEFHCSTTCFRYPNTLSIDSSCLWQNNTRFVFSITFGFELSKVFQTINVISHIIIRAI